MQVDLIRPQSKFLLEALDQSSQMLDLAICEGLAIAIANQADADGACIVCCSSLTHDVGAGELLNPPIADVDFAVRQAVAIADEEVVPQALIVP